LKNKYNRYIIFKRCFDISLSFVGIFIFLIPLFFIGLLIMITSGKPIFYWSIRVGKENCCFKMLKFRTVKNNSSLVASDQLHNSPDCLIPFGKFLRHYGLDELPQLLNILKGDMSLVGPRPLILADNEILNLRRKKGIESIKPGLTGLAQINGRSALSIHEKVYYDELYMKNMCILLDIRILVNTFFYIFKN
jgi:O-antigen biosynthesis protein WbqP